MRVLAACSLGGAGHLRPLVPGLDAARRARRGRPRHGTARDPGPGRRRRVPVPRGRRAIRGRGRAHSRAAPVVDAEEAARLGRRPRPPRVGRARGRRGARRPDVIVAAEPVEPPSPTCRSRGARWPRWRSPSTWASGSGTHRHASRRAPRRQVETGTIDVPPPAAPAPGDSGTSSGRCASTIGIAHRRHERGRLRRSGGYAPYFSVPAELVPDLATVHGEDLGLEPLQDAPTPRRGRRPSSASMSRRRPNVRERDRASARRAARAPPTRPRSHVRRGRLFVALPGPPPRRPPQLLPRGDVAPAAAVSGVLRRSGLVPHVICPGSPARSSTKPELRATCSSWPSATRTSPRTRQWRGRASLGGGPAVYPRMYGPALRDLTRPRSCPRTASCSTWRRPR